jgi:alanyl-tRNA synthetase
LKAEIKITKYRKIKTKGKELFQLVFDKSPFYAESGGQTGDAGKIENANESIHILDTKKENNLYIHITEQLPENPEAGFFAYVDIEKRQSTMLNHSATHLLHAALRNVLGKHVEQKGSLVNESHLRFDFSHFSKLTNEEIAQIEDEVNQKIRSNIALNEQRNVPIEEAKKMGAMALFGEKYGEFVRVITFDKNYSVELCGGTHVNATGNIGVFKITSESAIAAGVRRIEAVTGKAALMLFEEEMKVIAEIREILKTKDISKALHQLIHDKQDLQKKYEHLIHEKTQFTKKQLLNKIEKHGEVNCLFAKLDVENAESLKNITFQLKQEVDNIFMVLGAEIDGKALLSVALNEKLIASKGLNATQIVKQLGKYIEGGGGGQAFYATAGGKNLNGIEKALQEAKTIISA